METYSDADVFRLAAERVYFFDSIGCCAAIVEATNELSSPPWIERETRLYQQFSNLFCPLNLMNEICFWWPYYSANSQQERALALLFAAEIAETGGF